MSEFRVVLTGAFVWLNPAYRYQTGYKSIGILTNFDNLIPLSNAQP